MQFFRFRPEIPFLGKFGKKKINRNKNKIKIGIKGNSSMQNSMVMFTFSVLDQKDPFRANLVQKIKIVSLS